MLVQDIETRQDIENVDYLSLHPLTLRFPIFED